MKKISYCHDTNTNGLVCIHRRDDGVCMARDGILGRCKLKKDYHPVHLIPPIESFSPKVEDANKESKDYLRGFRDGVLSVINTTDKSIVLIKD